VNGRVLIVLSDKYLKSDASQSRFTSLRNHHRLGWLPETAK
jgi:hypothetical protein